MGAQQSKLTENNENNYVGPVIYVESKDTEEMMKKSLNRMFKYTFIEEQKYLKDITFYIPYLSSDRYGDMILSELEKDSTKKIIVMDFDFRYKGESGLQFILKYPNVKTIKLPFDIPDLHKLVRELGESDSKETNEELNNKIFDVKMENKARILGSLQHRLGHFVDKNGVIIRKDLEFEELITKTKKIFDIKEETSDESVIKFLLNTKNKIEKVMDGDISGVYCDIDDTIIGSDGKIIKKTLKIIKELEKQGKEIIIWTGGDLSEAKKKIEDTPFEKYKIVSKYDYAGATAEVIIDNVSPEKFNIQYGIKAKKYIRINN